jgi:hypothetical protein
LSTNSTAGEHYIYNLNISGSITLDNTSGGTAVLLNTENFTPSLAFNRYRVFARVRVAGSGNAIVYGSSGFMTGTPLGGNELPTGITSVVTFSDTFLMPVTGNGGGGNGIDAGDIQILDIGVEVKTYPTTQVSQYQPPYPINGLWRNSTAPYATPVDVNVILDLTSINLTILPSANIQVTGTILNINQYVPVEIKQSDFVKSILQMYNLYVEQDINNQNNLILRHRDEYYDSGAEKDWSRKLAKDKDQQLIFLPDLSNKKLKLTYAPDEDDFNTMYTQATAEIYGQIEYTFDNEYVKDVATQELIFSPTPVTLTSFGAYVPGIIGQAPNTNIRILYDGGVQSCQPYDILDFGTTGEFGLTSYPMLGHFDNALTPSFDINFGTNDFYFYEPLSLTSNNLYNLYWRRTVNQINVGKMLIAYFDLREVDIQSLKLNDKIYIDNSWWNINKIQDYNGNQRQLTKVELISIDTEIDLAPFKIGRGRPFGDVMIGVGVDSLLTKATFNNNVILPGANALVFGKGNVVTAGTKGVIVGDGQTLSEDGMVVSNLTVTGTINGDVVVPYKKYIATVTQTGTADPTVTVLENTIGDIVWTRFAVGNYAGTLVGAFPDQDKTYVIVGQNNGNFYNLGWNTIDDLLLLSSDPANISTDGLLLNTTIEIRTY